MLGWTIRPRFMCDMVSVEYLQHMAQSGWQLKILGRSFLYFKKCPPETITYSVDVMSKDRLEIEHSIQSPRVQEYIGMCQEFGWDFVDGDGVFFVFSTKKDAVPLQTDPEGYWNSIQTLRNRRILRQFAIVGFFAVVMVVLYALTGLYSVLLSNTSIMLTSAFCVYFAWIIVQWLWSIMLGRKAEKQLKAGAVPKEMDDRKWAWIDSISTFGLLLLLTVILCVVQHIPMIPMLGLAAAFALLWSIGSDLLYHMFWIHFQTSRLAAVILVGTTIMLLEVGAEVMTGLPIAWGVPTMGPIAMPVNEDGTYPWDPFVTGEDLGWPASENADSKWKGTRHAVEYNYSAGTPYAMRYELFYSPYKLAVDSFCRTAERYYLPGPGVVEVTDRREYVVETVPQMEVSGWKAFWNHYLLRIDDWAFHVMADDVLTQEQIEILANKMNYYIAEKELGE